MVKLGGEESKINDKGEDSHISILMSKLLAFAGALRDNVSELIIFDNSSDGVLQLN